MAASNRCSIFSYLIKISLAACLAPGLVACDSSGSNNNGSSDTIDKIEFTSDQINLAVGSEAALILTAWYTDGSSQRLTDQATWQSDNADIVTVSSTGTIIGMAHGTATITATFEGSRAFANVVVDDARVIDLQLTYDTRTIITTLDTQLTLSAFYNNGSTVIVTDIAEWDTANDAVATVIAGKVAGVAPGAATISAKFGGREARVVINVTDAPLKNVQLTDDRNIVAGASTQLTLTAFYDGYSRVVNDHAKWKSSDPDVATITTTGKVTGIKAGKTEITVTFEGNTESAQIIVFDTDYIELTYGTQPIQKGLSKQLTLTAFYNDGDSLVVNSSADWHSSDKKVASVTDDGEVFGVAKGIATISATFAGDTEQAHVVVSDAALTGVELTCEQPCEINAGLSTQLTLTAFYDDDTNEEVSHVADWQSDNLEATAVLAGKVFGIIGGEAEITAKFGEFEESITINVAANASMTGLQFEDDDIDVMVNGSGEQLILIASYSNDTNPEVTDYATWQSDNPKIATVVGGKVQGVAMGTTEITAYFGSYEISALVTVITDDEVDLTVNLTPDSDAQIIIRDKHGEVLCQSAVSCPVKNIAQGSQLILQAEPDNIADFIGWDGIAASCGNSLECKINIDHDTQINASFDTPMTTIDLQVLRTYNESDSYISLSPTTWRTDSIGGSGNICGNKSYSCSIKVPKRIGDLIFSAKPDPRHTMFDRWSGGHCSGKADTCKIELSDDNELVLVSIKAHFFEW